MKTLYLVVNTTFWRRNIFEGFGCIVLYKLTWCFGWCGGHS